MGVDQLQVEVDVGQRFLLQGLLHAHPPPQRPSSPTLATATPRPSALPAWQAPESSRRAYAPLAAGAAVPGTLGLLAADVRVQLVRWGCPVSLLLLKCMPPSVC
jgi:hypothetical protein